MNKMNRAFFLTAAGALWLLLPTCAALGAGEKGHMMMEDNDVPNAMQKSNAGSPESIPVEPEEQGKPPSAMRQDDMPAEMPKVSRQLEKARESKPMPMPTEPR